MGKEKKALPKLKVGDIIKGRDGVIQEVANVNAEGVWVSGVHRPVPAGTPIHVVVNSRKTGRLETRKIYPLKHDLEFQRVYPEQPDAIERKDLGFMFLCQVILNGHTVLFTPDTSVGGVSVMAGGMSFTTQISCPPKAVLQSLTDDELRTIAKTAIEELHEFGKGAAFPMCFACDPPMRPIERE
jgi:hypothetical protein